MVGITSHDFENFLFWYGPLAFSLVVLITALLWRHELPKMGWVFITFGAICVVLSGFWIACLHAWDATQDWPRKPSHDRGNGRPAPHMCGADSRVAEVLVRWSREA